MRTDGSIESSMISFVIQQTSSMISFVTAGDLQDMIWHILLILEEASLLSSSNHEFKILKMEVYSALG